MWLLSDQICDDPVFLAKLDVLDSQGRNFWPPQTTADEQREYGLIPLCPKVCSGRCGEKSSACSAESQFSTRTSRRLAPSIRRCWLRGQGSADHNPQLHRPAAGLRSLRLMVDGVYRRCSRAMR
jgi:hypothetical protein